jgi:hypothetical protein
MPTSRLLALSCALAASAALAAADDYAIGDFANGTDGFDGAFAPVAHDGRAGEGCARLVNDHDGWVEGGKDIVGLKHDLTQVGFWVRSSTAHAIAVRLTDSTGQSFQHRRAFDGGDWRHLTIDDPAQNAQSWGGANDHAWHPPLRRIAFILEGGHNDIAIDAVTATLDARTLVAPLALSMAAPGNVFLAGETVALPVESSAATVSWTATDFWGAVVAQGDPGRGPGRPPSRHYPQRLLHRARNRPHRHPGDRRTRDRRRGDPGDARGGGGGGAGRDPEGR